MRLLLNVIWLVLAGFWLAVGYAVAGIICCLLIVTIPFGIASFRIANYALWPFGRTLADRPGAGAPSLLGNIVWIVFAGWWLALEHVVTGVLLCLTVIGIPLGVANFKLVPVSLLPLGREIVPAPR
ncbi:YccF domain-containing protein [Prauserella shujinwangii]|nr:YccF domain-containing protein [Prauserella shujinwangii]